MLVSFLIECAYSLGKVCANLRPRCRPALLRAVYAWSVVLSGGSMQKFMRDGPLSLASPYGGGTVRDFSQMAPKIRSSTEFSQSETQASLTLRANRALFA